MITQTFSPDTDNFYRTLTKSVEYVHCANVPMK